MENNNKKTYLNNSPLFSVTMITSENGNLNKKYSLDADGNITKTAAANLVKGTFEVKHFSSTPHLDDFFDNLQPTQAVMIGIPHHNGKQLTSGRIVKKDITEAGAINRTKEFFDFENTFYFDLDSCSLNIEEVITALTKIDPQLASANLLVRASSSFGIHREDETATSNTCGYHVWVLGVKDSNDINRYGKTFAKRCWLAGLGYIYISEKKESNGAMHIRQLIDVAVFSPERLVYEAKPTLAEGLVQDLVAPIIQEGESLDTSLLLDLDAQEQIHYDFLTEQAKKGAQKKSEAIKKRYIERGVKNAVGNGQDMNLARNQIEASLSSGNLYSSQILNFDLLGKKTVGEVLANLPQFDEATLSDPFSPEINGRKNVAIMYSNDGKNPIIYSQAHGGKNYYLKNDPHLSANSDVDLALHIASAIADKKLEKDNVPPWIVETMEERNLPSKSENYLLTTIIKQLDLGKVKTSLKKEVKKARQELREDSHTTFNRDGICVPIDLRKKLDINLFPDVEFNNDKAIVIATIENLKALLKSYGITYSYDVISKHQKLIFPDGTDFCDDIADNAKLAQVKSLCRQNGMPANAIEYLTTLFAKNFVNPVVDYLSSLKWDGKDHIKALADSVGVAEHSQELWLMALTKWFIQCVASADNAMQTPNKLAVAKFEYCLVFISSQGISKTDFFNQLIPSLLKEYFVDGLILDLHNKDSIKQAISNWIVELGEIEGTFSKSSVSQLKAFLSKRKDTIRLPYDPTESHFKRRTTFCGSVNDAKFLVDKTGNRRFYPIEVKSIPVVLPVDINQLFAQVWALYLQGEQWWPDMAMESLLEKASATHAKDSAVRESLLAEFDLKQSGDLGELHTFKAIREKLNLPNSNAVITEIRQVLEIEFKIQKKTIKGEKGYKLMPHQELFFDIPSNSDHGPAGGLKCP